MRQLAVSEASAVFGGDNPGMGPYTPPITAADIGTFNNAFTALAGLGMLSVGALSALGPMGMIAGGALAAGAGLAAFASYSYLNSVAASYNTLNGYDAAGTTYLGSGSGGSGGGGTGGWPGGGFLASQP